MMYTKKTKSQLYNNDGSVDVEYLIYLARNGKVYSSELINRRQVKNQDEAYHAFVESRIGKIEPTKTGWKLTIDD